MDKKNTSSRLDIDSVRCACAFITKKSGIQVLERGNWTEIPLAMLRNLSDIVVKPTLPLRKPHIIRVRSGLAMPSKHQGRDSGAGYLVSTP